MPTALPPHTPQVVDLRSVAPAELETFWEHDLHLWRHALCWDIADRVATLRRVAVQRRLPGKAVRCGTQLAGYTYYGTWGDLGMLGSFSLAAGADSAHAGTALLHAAVQDLRQQGVVRIESQFIAPDGAALVPMFEAAGFQTSWRACLRRDVALPVVPGVPSADITVAPWHEAHLTQAAVVMQAAHVGTADAETNLMYRSTVGCRSVLEDVLHQGHCGRPLLEASGMAFHQGQGIGFIVITETAPGHGHLVQVAVVPAYKHRGIGRLLLHHSLSQLAIRRFETLSLLVSQANLPACHLYRALGFHTSMAFPVFIWP